MKSKLFSRTRCKRCGRFMKITALYCPTKDCPGGYSITQGYVRTTGKQY